MSDYIVYTDSACDISPEILDQWGVRYLSLTFRFEGDETEYSNSEMPPEPFYAKMRAGEVAKTSAVNVETFKNAFEPELRAGKDILYIGFSSGLSNTVNAAQIAANELLADYPGRKLIVVDTLSASAGFGMLLYLTLKRRDEGATIEEAAQFATDTRLHQCHWFTVDDLMYLKRGGRISPAVALVGTMLGIKPVLHMDNEGHLVKVSQAQGRAQGAGGQVHGARPRARLRHGVHLPRRLHGRRRPPQGDAQGPPRRGRGAGDLCGPGDRRPFRPGHSGAVLPWKGALNPASDGQPTRRRIRLSCRPTESPISIAHR